MHSDFDDVLKLPDIEVGLSLGARFRNYDVLLPNGNIVNLAEGTRITDIEVIAGKGQIRIIDEIDALFEEFGGNPNDWQKVKGFVFVDYEGESYFAELHWYQEPSVGKVKMKVKPQLGGNWYVEDQI